MGSVQRSRSSPIEGTGDRREALVYRDRARRLGLSFVPAIDLGASPKADLAAIRQATFAMRSDGEGFAYLAPDEDALATVRHWLERYPAARSRLRVTTRSAIRSALLARRQAELTSRAIAHLSDRYPHLSARRVVTLRQVVVGLAAIAGLATAAAIAPAAAVFAINLAGAALFFGVTALRFVAAGHAARRPPPKRRLGAMFDDARLPVYTILVPLRDEARLVAGLVAALDGIDWPRDRLDVKLILEADDAATIAAARRAVHGAPYELVVVPPVGPRTKPKALAYALPLCRGDFVTVYDAEDRPHPGQLREAYAAFCRSPAELACLQSPLVIENEKPNWLSRSFAIEYAALFDGLLPMLAAHGMPLPLGGTSNHFRRAALDASGGWDPFNVTEDADLGARLARLGYRSATLDLPTYEDAPTGLRLWTRQRTRWSKGWMQTWLVHMRQPVRTARELGSAGALGFHLVSTGLIVSSLVYPVYLAMLVLSLTDPFGVWQGGGVLAGAIVGVGLFNLFAGYIAMAVLVCRALQLRGRMREAPILMLLPIYWLLASLASYRALLHLVTRPFAWDKTPHCPRAASRAVPFR